MSKNRNGFTLLEATVSLAIIALVSIAALETVARELDVAARTRIVLEAAALAEDRLEALRLSDPIEILPLPDSLSSGRFNPPFSDYTWSANSTTQENVAPGVIDLRVEVFWAGGSYVLETHAYRPSVLIREPTLGGRLP